MEQCRLQLNPCPPKYNKEAPTSMPSLEFFYSVPYKIEFNKNYKVNEQQ